MKANRIPLLTVAALLFAAGLAAPSAVLAQPAARYMGVIGNNTYGTLSAYCNETVNWFRVDLTVPTSVTQFYDFHTEGRSPTDLELALYSASGTLIAQNDDWDTTSRNPGLSFGQSYPRRHHDAPLPAQLNGRAFSGQDGGLAAGTYYCCVTNYNATFYSPFGVTTTTGGGPSTWLTVDSNSTTPTPPIIFGQARSDSPRPGENVVLRAFVAPGTLPVSFGLRATVDASSLGGGAAMELNDNGVNGDETAIDDFWSVGLTLPQHLQGGLYTLPLRVTDYQGRINIGQLDVHITPLIDISLLPQLGTIVPGDATIFRAMVTPGISPASTGVRVFADLTSVGGDIATPLYDDGTNGDAFAGDNIFTVTQHIAFTTIPGTYDLPMIVIDDQGRSETTLGTGAITVLRQPNLRRVSNENPHIAVAENLHQGEVLWYNFLVPMGANATHYFDINTLDTNITNHDTMIGLYDAFGNLLATSDDWDPSAPFPLNRPSMLTFGQSTLPRHYAPWTKDADGSSAENLPRGLYYLAVTGYPAVFGPNFMVTSAHTLSGISRVNIYTGASCSPADIVDGGGIAPGDGIVDGSDFVAFINSFGVGDVTIDPLADVYGDNIIDGSDFIDFINFFSEGC